MYVPPYEYILRKIGAVKGEVGDDDLVKVPLKFVKMLLQFAVANRNFDEQAYLRMYPDVAKAVEDGHFLNGLYHYLAVGYFEGRQDGSSHVDESWYLREYPDVAAEIRDGHVLSARDHFHMYGAKEGRIPAETMLQDIHFWIRNLDIQ